MTTKKELHDTHSEPAVASILEGASPRPRAPRDDRDAVFAAVHAEWTKLSARRIRRRRSGIALLAASVVASLAVVLLRPGPLGQAPQVASIERLAGSVLIESDGESVWRAVRNPQRELRAGDRIRVLDGGLALRLSGGGSLRVGAQSTVQLLEAATIDMQTGKVYFDSENGVLDANIVIKTAFGTVRDIGTKFSVDADAARLGVSVREGSAALGRVHEPAIVARAGERVTVDSSGEHARTPIAPTGEEWAWADQLSPSYKLKNRSPEEVLQWFTDQTGYRLKFASASAEQIARTERLRGGSMEDASFEQLLWVLETVGLAANRDISPGTILISVQD